MVSAAWLIGWFLINEETGACWLVEVGGVLFFAALWRLHDSLATKSGSSGNDGAGKLFWGIQNLSSRCFLVAIKFLSNFMGKCQCKYAVLLRWYQGKKLQDAIDQSGAA